MWPFVHHSQANWPPEVATSLEDLLRFEWLVSSRKILPDYPVYSLLAGRHASKLRGRGLDFEEVRQYVAGDDIRNIDWRVTARTGTTHSKVFNEEKERPSFLVVDQCSHMFFGSVRFMKSVTAVHAAALAAFYTIKRGDRIGGLVFSDTEKDFVAPRRSKALVQHLLQVMVNRNRQLPQQRHGNQSIERLNEMLYFTLNTVTHDYVICVISDFSRINADTMRLLQQLASHNDVILNHVYDPLEENLPPGKLLLTDGRRQIAWNNKRRNWGEKFSADFQQWKRQFSEAFRHSRVPVVFLSTATPVEDQIKFNLATTRQHG